MKKFKEWDERIVLNWTKNMDEKRVYLARFISFFGREPLWFALTSFFIFIYIDYESFFLFGNTMLCGLILVNTAKLIFQRERPYVQHEEVEPLERRHKSKSFPSWHTYNAVANFLVVGYITESIWVYVVGLIFSAMIGVTRISLGVHYPIDVAVGYILGIAGFFIALNLVPYWLNLVDILEEISKYNFADNDWNPLFRYWWWYLEVAAVYLLIGLAGSYHSLKKLRGN